MRFTDYYAEPSCTAGRANFITGELPIRTGLTTVGQAGATVGMPDEAPTIATALKAMGYETGPVRQEPSRRPEPLSADRARVRRVSAATSITWMRWRIRSGIPIPPAAEGRGRAAQPGPQLCHHVDDPTVQPRWGKIGKQRIVDDGPLPPHPMPGIKYNMETVDEDILDHAVKFIDKAEKDGKPFFVWMNPTRAHVISHLSPKYAGEADRRERVVSGRRRDVAAR